MTAQTRRRHADHHRVDQTGPLARPGGAVLGRKTRWYLAMESVALKEASEAAAREAA